LNEKVGEKCINFAKIGGEIHKFCGNRGNMRYASLPLGGWMPLAALMPQIYKMLPPQF